MNNYDHIQSLFLRYMEGTITAEERLTLSEAAETYSTKEWEEILEPLITQSAIDNSFNIADWEKEIQFILSQPAAKQIPVVPLYRRQLFKYIAAASIILVAALGYLVISNQWWRKAPGSIGEKSPSSQDVEAPKETRAVITLANGSKVYLDSAGNGVLARQSNVAVVRNADGSIEYNRKDAKTQSNIVYNTLFNPRGSKVISLTLSDGTKVWLNSESSLRYPASFASTAVNREVEITGEAYFEVKHNAKQPFKVHLPNGSIVEDLGTSFNINSYSDEANIKTTLIEGSVRLFADSASSASSAVKIKPGQQAVINQANPKISRIEVQTNVDVDKIIAWKDGWFEFTNTEFATIMRQLSRWYDLDVHYEGLPTDEKFAGRISKNLPLKDVLHLLESNGVKFKVEGRKVIVLK